MVTATAESIQIAESAANARSFVANGHLLFDTVAQRNAAAEALQSHGFEVERVTRKFPGRYDVKPAIRFV